MSVNTILVLEDERLVMTLLVRILGHYPVVEATTAEQAIQLFNDRRPDINLLIADVTLPTSSGIQVALLLRSHIPALPVILTSGYPLSGWNDRDTADLKRLGATSVTILRKPFPVQMIRDAVWELIGAPPAGKARTA